MELLEMIGSGLVGGVTALGGVFVVSAIEEWRRERKRVARKEAERRAARGEVKP